VILGAEFYKDNKDNILILGNLPNRDGSFDNEYFYHYCGKVIKNK
jgi:hypothetical protein